MNKGDANSLCYIYRHLVWDAEEMLQMKPMALKDDLERIILSSKSRGFERVFLLDLPEICSDFEQALEMGQYAEKNGTFRKGGHPSIFRGILSNIFDDNWVLLERPCTLSIRLFRQLTRCFKKYEIECPDSVLKEKIHEFERIESELVSPIFSWGSVGFDFRGNYPSLIELGFRGSNQELLANESGDEPSLRCSIDSIQRCADRLAKSFNIDWTRFRPKHGPGAVSEGFENSKFEFPSWNLRLEQVFPFYENGTINGLFYELEEPVSEDPPAKLIDVPKDYRGPRLIASEPICSQYIQQGIMGEIRRCLKKSPLRFSYNPYSQEPSRDLVLECSLDGSFSTIDLSSASDRLSCALVECIFRKNYTFLKALNAARTPSVLLPDGRTLALRKFAAQGAAFTFPVQSLVYAIICVGVILSYEDITLQEACKKVRVFGDDIIVPVEYHERVCACLELFQLKVNGSKSFHKGLFRESCGMDSYAGDEVTAVSVHKLFKRSDPVTLVSAVEISNNLYLKGYLRASYAVQQTIPKDLRKNIPHRRPGSKLPLAFIGGSVSSHSMRWNAYWHLHEEKHLVVENKVVRTNPNGYLSLFQWFNEEPSPDVVWHPGNVEQVKARYRLRWVSV